MRELRNPEGKNWLALLPAEEEAKVKVFLEARFFVSQNFWEKNVLYRKQQAVWICSKEAWETQKSLSCKSTGLMLVQDISTMKLSNYAENIFKKIQ